ncbi:MAG: TlpA family protein disulfide reductase [Candidatus Thermoplasmatota archaeon]|jgi:thiol-disulfide isomerase/thioredoxin|nr:TlpA family protein disulfide reductase [Candidatus Thermoplasmatota archaeon]
MGSSYKRKARQRKRTSRMAGNGADVQKERAALLPLAVIAVVILIVGGSAYLYLSNHGSDGADGTVDDDNVQNDPGTGVQTGPLSIPLENIEGGTFKLSELKGRVVVLDMMATWCGPCKLQMEELRELRKTFSPSRVEIVSVGVDLSESATLLRGFKTDENADWPFAASNQAFNEAFPAGSIPTLYILDQNGKVAKTHVGVTDIEILSTEVSSLLA